MIKRLARWADRHFEVISRTIVILILALPIAWTLVMTVNDVNAAVSAYDGASGASEKLIRLYYFSVWLGYIIPVLYVFLALAVASYVYGTIASKIRTPRTSTKDG